VGRKNAIGSRYHGIARAGAGPGVVSRFVIVIGMTTHRRRRRRRWHCVGVVFDGRSHHPALAADPLAAAAAAKGDIGRMMR
jgi:hypothetical protein